MLPESLLVLLIANAIGGLPFQERRLVVQGGPPANESAPHQWAIFKNLRGDMEVVNLYPTYLPDMTEFVVDPDKVEFFLYTKANVSLSTRIYVGEKESLLKAGFKPEYKTKFIVHGFMNDLNSDTIQTIKNNFFSANYEEYNVIAVDWSAYTVVYMSVYEKARGVGDLIGAFMDFLVGLGTPLANIHCIGHSLGAHACGFAGGSVVSGKIARISGLDPALPGFTVTSPDHRLTATDAVFVDCIHTCGGFLGIDEPICSADYYPNTGKNQPGCHWYDFGSCSHGRSHEFYAESILEGHLFPAFSCEDLKFSADDCVFKGALMGYPAVDKYTGIFYIETNDEYPYAKNWTIGVPTPSATKMS